MSDGQPTDSRKQWSQTRYPGTVNAPKLEPQTRHKDMTLLQDLKNEIYKELNVETTVQVKELYPSYNLRRTSDWLELKAELVAKATDTQTEEPTVIAEVVITDEEVGEVLTMPTVDPEWVADEVPEPDAPMPPVPVALWDFMPGHNLTDVLSPWVHYLQWLDRLYTNVSIVFESTFRSYQNA